jgi:hypothetical protein
MNASLVGNQQHRVAGAQADLFHRFGASPLCVNLEQSWLRLNRGCLPLRGSNRRCPLVAGWSASGNRGAPGGASFPDVSGPGFHFVCVPSALLGLPAEWASEMLGEGEIALLADAGGFAAINEVAHALGLISVPLVRSEETVERQQETVMAYAGRLPLVWVGEAFSERVIAWAGARGPMTLLVEARGPLSEDERRRIERFVVILGRQSE